MVLGFIANHPWRRIPDSAGTANLSDYLVVSDGLLYRFETRDAGLVCREAAIVNIPKAGDVMMGVNRV